MIIKVIKWNGTFMFKKTDEVFVIGSPPSLHSLPMHAGRLAGTDFESDQSDSGLSECSACAQCGRNFLVPLVCSPNRIADMAEAPTPKK